VLAWSALAVAPMAPRALFVAAPSWLCASSPAGCFLNRETVRPAQAPWPRATTRPTRWAQQPLSCAQPDPSTADANAGADADAAPEPPPKPRQTRIARAANRISGTVVGRAIVELCALAVGALLLVVVVAWRALRWLANVRRLGKWAWARSHVVGDALRAAPRLLTRHGQADACGASRGPVRHSESEHSQRDRGENAKAVADVHVRPLTAVEAKAVSSSELADVQNELQRMRTLIEKSAAERASTTDVTSTQAATSGAASAAEMSQSLAGTHLSSRTGVSATPLRIVLMRHAKSAWDRSGEVQDFERQLSPQGRAEAALIGAELERRGWLPSHVLCSSSARTVETLRLLRASAASSSSSPSFGAPEPTITETLYFAVSADEMAAAIDSAASPHSLHATADSLLCIAHNPGCEALIEFLTGEKHRMGTASVALLEYGIGGDESAADESLRRSSGWKLRSQEGQYKFVSILTPQELLQAG
jgi:phosphohistidine phosphatase